MTRNLKTFDLIKQARPCWTLPLPPTIRAYQSLCWCYYLYLAIIVLIFMFANSEPAPYNIIYGIKILKSSPFIIHAWLMPSLQTWTDHYSKTMHRQSSASANKIMTVEEHSISNLFAVMTNRTYLCLPGEQLHRQLHRKMHTSESLIWSSKTECSEVCRRYEAAWLIFSCGLF